MGPCRTGARQVAVERPWPSAAVRQKAAEAAIQPRAVRAVLEPRSARAGARPKPARAGLATVAVIPRAGWAEPLAKLARVEPRAVPSRARSMASAAMAGRPPG